MHSNQKKVIPLFLKIFSIDEDQELWAELISKMTWEEVVEEISCLTLIMIKWQVKGMS